MFKRLTPADSQAAKSALAIVGFALLTTLSSPSRAQSDISLGLSALPIASVAVVAGATIVLPAALLSGGAVLTIKAVESTAKGGVIVLERASDGTRFSIELTGDIAKGSATVAGAVVVGTVIGTGMILSVAGEAIAFVPNELGKGLLYNQRLTN